MAALSTVDSERARTWNVIIAETLLGAAYRDEGHERKWLGSGGFHIDKRDGAWFSFAEGKGGESAVALVRFIGGYSQKAAVLWISSFLAKHPGTGPSDTAVVDDDSETRRRARAAEARHILDTMAPVDGTAAEKYLLSRSLPAPYSSDLLGYIEDARIGESALVAVLRADNRVVGVQVTYLDPDGRKSLAEPVRQRFNLEPAAHAVFEISPAGLVHDKIADTVVAEGLEDGLSISRLGRQWHLIAVPGVGVIPHLKARPGERVLIVRDGDEPGSDPDKALAAGIDHLLLAKAVVKLTPTPRGADANSILCAHSSLAPLIKLVASAADADRLTTAGEAKRLALISDDMERDIDAKVTAKRLGVGVDLLRKAVKAEMRRAAPATPAAASSEYPDDTDAPWTGKVDLNAALNAAAARIPKFLAAPAVEHYATVTVLWDAATHLVRNENLAIAVMPQLGASSIGPDSGKSLLLEIVSTLAYRGRRTASPTLATLFRVIDRDKATYCLPELHNLDPARNLDLRTVLNACHRRAEAKVERTIERNGDFVPVTYDCWAALAWGSIGAMPAEITSRAIVLPMRPATEAEAATLLNASPSHDRTLQDVRRHFAAWAATMHALPVVDLPKGLINRNADNWRVLFQLAKVAGVAWPQRVREAYEYFVSIEDRPLSREARLLISIRDTFTEAKAPADGGDKFLATPELIDALLADEEAGWGEERHGKPITHYWLRDNLRGLLNPAGSKKQNDIRGYFASQFSDAFLRYLPPKPSGSSVLSVSSVGDTDTSLKSAVFSSTDQGGASVRASVDTSIHTDSQTGTTSTRAEFQDTSVDSSVYTENRIGTACYNDDQTDKTDKTDQTDAKGGKAREGGKPKPKRARKPNGRAPELPHLGPKPPPIDDATIDAAIRELRYQNPDRSLAWLATYLGLPKSRVRTALDAEDAS